MMWLNNVAPSSAEVKIVTSVNETFQEALQFDDPDQTGWNFNNKTFAMSIKGNYEQDVATLTFTSGAGDIVVDNATTRILHFNVPKARFDPVTVPPGTYVYDFLMTDGVSGVVTQLMHGQFILADGVTA